MTHQNHPSQEQALLNLDAAILATYGANRAHIFTDAEKRDIQRNALGFAAHFRIRQHDREQAAMADQRIVELWRTV